MTVRQSIVFLLALVVAATGLHAQRQAELNQDACAQYKKTDQLLNQTYSQVLKEYANDPEFLIKFRQAQRAWIAFRDANLAARFPKANKQMEYGSMYPTCRCSVLKELTEQRTQELKVWVNGIPEGDVCNGSVKTAMNESSDAIRASVASGSCRKGSAGL
jgi:uncharacterized protein YecT (DUF1311 family)